VSIFLICRRKSLPIALEIKNVQLPEQQEKFLQWQIEKISIKITFGEIFRQRQAK
jgi:hypothetical protein